jgi:hypothetical protein
MKCKSLRDLPYEVLAIVGAGSDDSVVKRVPVGIEDGSGMAAEERYLVRDFALLVERNDREGSSAAGLPIDREVLGVDLDVESTCQLRSSAASTRGKRASCSTFTRLVSHAFRLMCRLS